MKIKDVLTWQLKAKGFTLIELLVVIVIIGILAAIALPSFLNQSSKARETEAKTYLGSVNRAQQGYYFENTKFGTLEELDVALPKSRDFNYTAEVSETSVITLATPNSESVRAQSGKVFLVETPYGKTELNSIVCASENSTPVNLTGVTSCPQ
jgi:type IV pilus assembly protein PilA